MVQATDRITLQSPAKLNLYLKVLNKRKDGFHNIETLFERINLFDEISLISPPQTSSDNANKQNITRPKIRLVCNQSQVPTGPKNTVYKAIKLLREDLGINRSVEVRIKKQIPVAAGLAGGSSNAASVLLGLNTIWKLNLSRKQLVSYAHQIGSDVAFFLHDYSWGWGTGRGDKIKEVNIKTTLWHILVVPCIKMYSGKVYSALRKKTNILTKRNGDANILIRRLKRNNIADIRELLSNDLEKGIIRLRPSLLKLKDRVKSFQIKGVMISGSGPCVFGITETEKEARSIQVILKRRYSQVYVVKSY